MKEKILKIFAIVIIIITIYISTTSIIYWFKNPDKTQMETFLHIPKSFILDFNEEVGR